MTSPNNLLLRLSQILLKPPRHLCIKERIRYMRCATSLPTVTRSGAAFDRWEALDRSQEAFSS
jgi:hypothetical protein